MHCFINGCHNPRDYRGHHIKHRGSGGSDGPWNRLGLCRAHHTEIHAIGVEAFIKKYPDSESIIRRGISFEEIYQRWKRGLISEQDVKHESLDVWNYIKNVIK
jgi:hypothetical protein